MSENSTHNSQLSDPLYNAFVEQPVQERENERRERAVTYDPNSTYGPNSTERILRERVGMEACLMGPVMQGLLTEVIHVADRLRADYLAQNTQPPWQIHLPNELSGVQSLMSLLEFLGFATHLEGTSPVAKKKTKRQYVILRIRNCDEIDKEINKLAEDGWELVGPVAVSNICIGMQAIQDAATGVTHYTSDDAMGNMWTATMTKMAEVEEKKTGKTPEEVEAHARIFGPRQIVT